MRDKTPIGTWFIGAQSIPMTEFNAMVNRHEQWLDGEPGGERLVLDGARLPYLRIVGRDLRQACLTNCDLEGLKLIRSNCSGADLSGCCLNHASIQDNYLSKCNLQHTRLVNARIEQMTMKGSNFHGADLTSADLTELAMTPEEWADLYKERRIVPETGPFTAWKLVKDYIIELHIPESAERVGGLISRKCRVSYAYVAAILNERTHEPDDTRVVTTGHKKQTAYEVGQHVYPDQFDGRTTMECTHGIHCYRTLEEVTRF